MSDAEIMALLEQLDDEDLEQGEWALADLQKLGDRVLDPLLERVPSFGRFAKLSAIELFDDIGDPRASVVLLPMLHDEDESVRSEAASSLGWLGVTEAVELLRARYEELRREGTPMTWGEPDAIRRALTRLNVRTEVVPPFVAARARHVDPIGEAWPIADMVDVIEALVSARQWISWASVYTRNAGAYGWRVSADVEWPELDPGRPWAELVAEAREAALDVATHPRVPDDAYADMAWLDEADLTGAWPGRRG